MTCKYPSTLREKVIGLSEARDRNVTQKQLEETREEQDYRKTLLSGTQGRKTL